MSKIEKIGLAISCFSPLYVIFCIKNGVSLYSLFQVTCRQDQQIAFNIIMIGIWSFLILISIVSIIAFKKTFLAAKKKSSESVAIKSAENITSEHYFTYLSVFVLTFFTVDPTSLLDIVILGLLMVFIIVVYIKNEMWFDNPVINLVGYKSFKIQYCKNRYEDEEPYEGEINVFSMDPLNKMIGDTLIITYSQHDFSVCYKDT